MIPGLDVIHWVVNIFNKDKDAKAIKEAVENQIKKDYSKKSMIAYAETLAKNTTQKEFEYIVNEQEGVFFGDLDKSILDACKKEYCMITESVSKEEIERRYPIDTVMGELHDSIDPLKYSKPDITITKAQAELVSELIDFYIDRRAGSPAFNEDNLISLMAKLNVSGV